MLPNQKVHKFISINICNYLSIFACYFVARSSETKGHDAKWEENTKIFVNE